LSLGIEKMPLPWNFILNNLILLEERKESKQNNHEISWVFDNTNIKAICQNIMNFEDVHV
jgi:hypothetical protein